MSYKAWKNDDFTPERLEELIGKQPLTEEGITQLLGYTEFIVHLLVDTSGKAMIYPIAPSKYGIHINANQTRDEQEKGLVHEIAHAYYQCGNRWGDFEITKKMDDLIEAEIQKFYGEHREFVRKLFESLCS